MNRILQVKEYDSIISDEKDGNLPENSGYKCLGADDFDELVSFVKEYSADPEFSDALDFMNIGYKRSVGDIVSVKNYVGLIQLESGLKIEILPKIWFESTEGDGSILTKRIFIKMLRSMTNFPCKVFSESSVDIGRMNIYEIFINMYLQEVRKLVKHGLRSSYVRQEDNLRFLKGKLLTGEQIRFNTAHKERFYVAYDEFHSDIPENKLIKSTLLKLQKVTGSMENSKEIRQLLTSFEMVSPSTNYESDFTKVNINRNTKDYEFLIPWSKVFLFNKSFTTFAGKTPSRSLLFPMESVYECYVAQEMKKCFVPDGWSVSSQDRGHYLFDTPRKQFALRPDIVMRKNGRVIIMDTKWKNLFNNAGKNYGIAQADMYQMYAYSKKYNTPEIWLLYPLNKQMLNHEPICFSSNDNVCVNLHFIDLENIETNLGELKETIYSTQANDIYTALSG